ncbi:hypothetical protein DFH29DRAFT_534387 [Suillus ampliporus]|nr:hypothetical protein DFH29DRAFT_534387 [Suillus ampliporus]
MSDAVPVGITSQFNTVHTVHRLDSSSPKTSIVPSQPPSQTHAAMPAITKPSITWNYTPPSTNPFFARALAFNAKALKKPLPVAEISSEPITSTSPVVPIASPAAVGSSTINIPPKPSVDEHASNAPAPASSGAISLLSSVKSSYRNNDRSILPTPADKAAVDAPLQLPQTELCDIIDAPITPSDQPSACEPQTHSEPPSMNVPITSDIPAQPATAPPSSVPLPVPPRVQRPITKLSLTELINQRREEHFRSRRPGEFIDLTDGMSPSSGDDQAPSASASKPHESVQHPHPTSTNVSSLPAPVFASQAVPSIESRTPSIQEIRDLMRQRTSSSKLSISSAASNPTTSSAASVTSALVPDTSSPRSITSNSTSSSNRSGSKPSSSSRKGRSVGMASLEMFISPIPDASQPASSKNKKATPRSGKRASCNADVFRRIITPTAEVSVRNHSLSPSEGRRTRRAVRSPSPRGTRADVAASGPPPSPSVQLRDRSHAPPELVEEPGIMSTTLSSAIPAERETEVQDIGAETQRNIDEIDDMLRLEGLQGVTESIGSLDLHEHSRSPEADSNVDRVAISPLENICEDGDLGAIPVSAELMEHEELESLEMLVDDVSAEATSGIGGLVERKRRRSASMGFRWRGTAARSWRN